MCNLQCCSGYKNWPIGLISLGNTLYRKSLFCIFINAYHWKSDLMISASFLYTQGCPSCNVMATIRKVLSWLISSLKRSLIALPLLPIFLNFCCNLKCSHCRCMQSARDRNAVHKHMPCKCQYITLRQPSFYHIFTVKHAHAHHASDSKLCKRNINSIFDNLNRRLRSFAAHNKWLTLSDEYFLSTEVENWSFHEENDISWMFFSEQLFSAKWKNWKNVEA